MQGIAVTGKVLEGARRGTALGFPTANIALTDDVLGGVYAGLVTAHGTTHRAALFADPTRKLLEAYILDFSGDLYGEEITIEVCERIRDSQAFENDDELRGQIQRDVNAVRAMPL